jgi:hypothetical protein
MVHQILILRFVVLPSLVGSPLSIRNGTGIGRHDELFDKRLGAWHYPAFFFSESMIPSTMHLFRHPDATNSAPSRCI